MPGRWEAKHDTCFFFYAEPFKTTAVGAHGSTQRQILMQGKDWHLTVKTLTLSLEVPNTNLLHARGPLLIPSSKLREIRANFCPASLGRPVPGAPEAARGAAGDWVSSTSYDLQMVVTTPCVLACLLQVPGGESPWIALRASGLVAEAFGGQTSAMPSQSHRERVPRGAVHTARGCQLHPR